MCVYIAYAVFVCVWTCNASVCVCSSSVCVLFVHVYVCVCVVCVLCVLFVWSISFCPNYMAHLNLVN